MTLTARTLTLVIALSALAAQAIAQIPAAINYQGRLTRPNGQPLAGGAVNLNVRLFAQLSGGSAIYDSGTVAVPLRQGVFSLALGQPPTAPLNPNIIAGGVAYVEVQPVGRPALNPRTPILAVPWSHWSSTANTVIDGAITTSKLADGAVTTAKIFDGTVSENDIANGAVTVTKLGDSSVSSAKIAQDAVTSTNLASDSGSLAKVTGGTMAVSSGRVGIGTTTPSQALDVRGAEADLRIKLDNGSGRSYNIISSGTGSGLGAGYFRLFDQTAGVDRLIITPLGSVGIGTEQPRGKFEVLGEVFIQGGINVYGGVIDWGNYAFRQNNKSSWDVQSDRRLKTNIRPLRNPLLDLLRLQGRTFEYRNRPKELRRGFVAQEVQAVFPDWVTVGKDGYLMINPDGFPALTVEAFREQQNQIDALKKENARLRGEINEIWKELKKRR